MNPGKLYSKIEYISRSILTDLILNSLNYSSWLSAVMFNNAYDINYLQFTIPNNILDWTRKFWLLHIQKAAPFQFKTAKREGQYSFIND